MNKTEVEKLESILVKAEELLMMSEARIDRTNDMVNKTFATFRDVAGTFERQITKLQENRDEVVKQNTSLIKLIEQNNTTIDIINKKYDALIDRLLMSKQTSENNINIR